MNKLFITLIIPSLLVFSLQSMSMDPSLSSEEKQLLQYYLNKEKKEHADSLMNRKEHIDSLINKLRDNLYASHDEINQLKTISTEIHNELKQMGYVLCDERNGFGGRYK